MITKLYVLNVNGKCRKESALTNYARCTLSDTLTLDELQSRKWKRETLEDKYIYMCNLCERLMREMEKMRYETK